MGDYDPRGRTNEYGRRQPPPEETRPESSGPEPDFEPAAEEASEPAGEAFGGTQRVEDATGHPVPSRDECQMAMFAHLGGLVAWYLSGGLASFIVPLAIWLAKKDTSPYLDDQGREALNFQLTALIFAFVVGFASLVLGVLTAGLALCLLVPLALAYGVYVLVFGVIASIKANEGVRYRYPFCLRML